MPGEKKANAFTGSWDNSVYLYSVAYGRMADQVLAHDDVVHAVSVCEDGTCFASASGDLLQALLVQPSQVDPDPSPSTTIMKLKCSASNYHGMGTSPCLVASMHCHHSRFTGG